MKRIKQKGACKVRILASDYDGTLRREDRVSAEDLQAIGRWRSAGNRFGLISGRGYTSLHKEAENNGVPCDFYICNNGCAIYDAGGQVLWEHTAPSSDLTDLVPFIIQTGGFHAAVTCGRKRFVVRYDGMKDTEVDEWIVPNQVANLPPFTQIDTSFDQEERAAWFSGEVNRRFAGKITAHQNGVCVDMVPAGGSKPAGLSQYAALVGLDESQILTVGDNYNDLGMIEAFHGFTVTSAKPEVIAKAAKVYESIACLIADQMGCGE